MNQRLALVFLVLLRMAIGWHFLFEALEKHRTISIGETAYNRPWSSEGYFREGTGPMASLVRWQIGDPDTLLLERLTLREAPLTAPPHQRLPARLDREWDDYLNRFFEHHRLDSTRQESARAILQQEKDRAVGWLSTRPGSVGWLLAGQWTDHDRTSFKRSYPGGTYDVNLSIVERAEEYRQLVTDYRNLSGERLFTMGKDVERTRRPAARAEVMTMRAELQGLLDKRSDEMKKALDSLLSKDEIRTAGPVPPPPPHWLIRTIDWSTRWGLTVIGIGLLLGLFSRSAALGGALFLVMTLLTHPPLPWLPVPPNSEGNYVFISKNVIEMLALFLLACTPSGRWFGLDSFLHPIVRALNPFRKDDPLE